MSSQLLRKYIDIITEANLINNYQKTLAVDVSAYELARLMHKFRAEDYENASTGEQAILTPLTKQEEEELKKFLKKEGVKFADSGEESDSGEENIKSVFGGKNS